MYFPFLIHLQFRWNTKKSEINSLIHSNVLNLLLRFIFKNPDNFFESFFGNNCNLSANRRLRHIWSVIYDHTVNLLVNWLRFYWTEDCHNAVCKTVHWQNYCTMCHCLLATRWNLFQFTFFFSRTGFFISSHSNKMQHIEIDNWLVGGFMMTFLKPFPVIELIILAFLLRDSGILTSTHLLEFLNVFRMDGWWNHFLTLQLKHLSASICTHFWIEIRTWFLRGKL